MAAADRTVRSLTQLRDSASTARTLNLWSVWVKHATEEGYLANRFFASPILNRAIILKHRLRAHEKDCFPADKSLVTKVIIPIDLMDLGAGARSFFINQRGYKEFLSEVTRSPETMGQDDTMLQLLDGLPSLDPFLMRERLAKEGFFPDRVYFNLTEGDAARMFSFVRDELTPLIGMSFKDTGAILNEKTTKLATKILANAADADLEPLRQGMGMSKEDFDEGVFCWKGFIYYKWTLTDLLPDVRPVGAQIGAIRPQGSVSHDDRAFIAASQARLVKAIAHSCETVRMTLKIYDDSYEELTRNGNPTAFRDFLLRAPDLFYELGDRLGALNHIVSFWRFRFPKDARVKVEAEELIDLLGDFEASLSTLSPQSEAA